MLNEAQYEQDWVAQGLAPERPHMETNRWLEAAFPTTTRRRPAPETETFELLGVKLVWTKDRGRPFPEPVLNAIKTLIEFAELPDGWNSYGGRNLNAIALRSVLELVIRGHQFAYVPRLVPMPDGGVSLIWEGGSKELELTVSADGSTEGLLSIGEDEVELMPGSPVAEGLALLERYFAAA